MCYHSKFGRSYSKLQRRWGFPKCAWGCWGLAPFVMWGVDDPREHVTPHICYTKLHHSRSVSFGVGRARKFGDVDPLEICFSPPVLPCQIQSVYVKQYERYYGERQMKF